MRLFSEVRSSSHGTKGLSLELLKQSDFGMPRPDNCLLATTTLPAASANVGTTIVATSTVGVAFIEVVGCSIVACVYDRSTIGAILPLFRTALTNASIVFTRRGRKSVHIN